MSNLTFAHYAYITFREDRDASFHRDWLQDNWHRSFHFSFAYLIAIFSVQQFMKSRRPFMLRKALIAWNLFLATFSIIGMFRVGSELYRILRDYGFVSSVCHKDHVELNPIIMFWVWCYGHSKVLELGDTAFVVLRKQPLRFLHYYHHTTVLLFVWYSLREENTPALWFMAMNLTIHSVMYSYYALKAAKVHVPQRVSMVITVLQIIQMLVGLYITYTCYTRKLRSAHCDVTYGNLNITLLMYASYFVLFLLFFMNTYFKRVSFWKVKSQ